MSQITSHVLDLSVGRPASGVPVSLFKLDESDQSKVTETIGKGVTNENGRATDLVETNIVLTKGSYKLHFNLSSYFEKRVFKSASPMRISSPASFMPACSLIAICCVCLYFFLRD